MKTWTEWEEVRHQVAIGGSVVDAAGARLSDVPVTITSGPKQFEARLTGAARTAGAEWEELSERLDRTASRSDGVFFFLDLPAGNYTLKVTDARSKAHDEKRASVKWRADGRVNMATVELKLAAG